MLVWEGSSQQRCSRLQMSSGPEEIARVQVPATAGLLPISKSQLRIIARDCLALCGGRLSHWCARHVLPRILHAVYHNNLSAL